MSTSAEERKRVYIAEETLVQRYYYDPDEIRRDFGEALDAWTGTFEDFVIDTFEEHNGSTFHGRYFYDDASPSYYVQLVERWDDE